MWICAALLVVGIQFTGAADVGGTIGFSTLGRLNFDFDVYTLLLPKNEVLLADEWVSEETRVTLGESVNYNAQLVEFQWDNSAVVERLKSHGHTLEGVGGSEALELLLYVSEVEGSPQLYLDIPMQANGEILASIRIVCPNVRRVFIRLVVCMRDGGYISPFPFALLSPCEMGITSYRFHSSCWSQCDMGIWGFGSRSGERLTFFTTWVSCFFLLSLNHKFALKPTFGLQRVGELTPK